MSEDLLFAGPIGRLGAADVLQFVAQSGLAAHVVFETEDRAHGWPRVVELDVEDGRVVAIGPRGAGMRLGDLAVGRRVARRSEVEAIAREKADEPTLPAHPERDPRLGARLVAAGVLDGPVLEDLLWERHARVVWGLLAWDRGSFTVTASPSGTRVSGAATVDPPLPLEALLLDGLQRAEAFAHADELAAFESDPGVS